MKLASLDAWTVPYTEPNDHGSTRYVSMCRVRDSDGATGWGEAVTLAPEAARATTLVLRAWADDLVGQGATPAEVRAAVTERTWWYGTHGGLSGFAVAALDTAMWDLLGHATGASVLNLLGGSAHPGGLATIVTTHATLADTQAQAELLAKWRAETGAAGVKVGFGKAGDAHLGFEHDRDTQFVAQLRRELGPEPAIMIDISPRVRWSVPEAIARTRAFGEHGLYWIEEPLGADNVDGYRRLYDASDCLIAYGEREWGMAGMARILDTGTVDVLGIDAGRAGGLTDFMAAATYARARGRQVNAHAFAGPISYAAGLTASLAVPNCHQFEVAPLRNSLMSELAPQLPRPHGRVGALGGAGLGVEIPADVVAAMAAD